MKQISYCIRIYYPSRDWTISFDKESERDETFEQIKKILLSEKGTSCFLDFTVSGKIFILSNVETVVKFEE